MLVIIHIVISFQNDMHLIVENNQWKHYLYQQQKIQMYEI